MHKKLIIVGLLAVLAGLGAGIYVLAVQKDDKTQTAAMKIRPTYAALGDSVAAGYGLYTASDSTLCYRYDESYPNVVAKTLELELKNYACSGASIGAGILGVQTLGSTTIDPQIESLTGAEKYVSVTVGANDVGWSEYIQKCFTADCGTETDTQAANLKRATLTANMVNLLNQLRTHVPETTKIAITGYYQIVSTNLEACSATLPLTQGELVWINEQTNLLNEAIKNATHEVSTASYSELDFTGHDLCSSDPWVQGVLDRAPFHPTEEGQKAIGVVVAKAFSN